MTENEIDAAKRLIEADLDEKIKLADDVTKKAAALKALRATVKAALIDAGFSNLATIIDNQIERA